MLHKTALAVALTLSGILLSCNGSMTVNTESQCAAVHNVFVTSPVPQGGFKFKDFAGIVEESRTISLGFKTAGQLETVLVKEGDYVSNGQLLATLDAKDYALAVKQLQVQYDQMKSDYKRKQYLYERGNLSDSEFEQATSALEQLGVQLQLNRNKLEYTSLKAPVSGYVTKVNFEKAEMVDAGTPVFDIMDDSSLEILVDLPVRDYYNKDNFSSFELIGKDSVSLSLVSITPKADNNQLYLMKLSLPAQSRKKITPGMNVSVRINTCHGNEESMTYAVPVRSVFKSGTGSCVWILNEDSTITARPVEVLELSAGNAIINNALSGDDVIVRAGVNSLHEGEKVHVIEQKSATNVGNLL